MARAKEYEKCSYVEQAGWAIGQNEYINGDLPGDDMAEFQTALRAKLAAEGKSEEFINGACWGAAAEDE